MREALKDRAIKAAAWTWLELTAWQMRRCLRNLEGTVALWSALAIDALVTLDDEEDGDAEADIDS